MEDLARPPAALARLALLGACTASFQTLLSRELLAVFSGNEAVIAALLGPWLVWTAAGAWLGRRGAGSALHPALALLAWGPASAGAIFAARLLPLTFEGGAAPGAAVALGWSALLLLLPCLLSGLSFSWLALPLRGSAASSRDSGGAGAAYFAESIGAAAAGGLLGAILLGRVPAFALEGGAVAAAAAAAAIGSRGPGRAALLALPGLAIGLALMVSPAGGFALGLGAPHLAGAIERESPRASILIARDRDETTVYVDRLPTSSTLDVGFAEETSLLPLSLHAAPKHVAILGAPPGGVARAAERHGVERIDLVLEDAVLAGVLHSALPDLSSPRVATTTGDVRRYLSQHRGELDAVLLFGAEPTSAEANRTFTVELFKAARAALRPGGIVSLALGGSDAYSSLERRRLHSSVARTLEAALGSVRVLPLGHTIYVAASDRELPPAGEVAEHARAVFATRAIAPEHLNAGTLATLLSAQRIADAARWSSLPEPINRDLRPTTYRIALDVALAELGDAGELLLLALAAAVAAAALLVFGPRSRPVELAVLTSGTAGIAGQLSLMLAYQIAAGALYRELALLTASFMLGAALGAWVDRKTARRSAIRVSLLSDFAQVVLAILLWRTLPALVSLGSGTGAHVWALLATALVGFFPGLQFAAAGRALEARSAAGTLWAADLAGAALASLVTFTFVVPAIGVETTFAAIAALKLGSAAALWLASKRGLHEAAAIPPRSRLAALFPLALGGFVFLGAAERTSSELYALTFLRPYPIAAVLILLGVLLAAFEPKALQRARVAAARRLSAARSHLRAGVERTVSFAVLLPVSAFPIARCYFSVPYLLCHVCPRQCVFGLLRPYIIPAALIANLHDRRFCERTCPLGTAQAAAEGLRGKRAVRATSIAVWVLRAAVLVFVAGAYLWSQDDRAEGIQGTGVYAWLFKNAFAPSAVVLGAAAMILFLSLFVRRPFCAAACPIGAVSAAAARVERLRVLQPSHDRTEEEAKP